jgi:tetratricopeptide (TPR) repeat protein
VRKLVVENTLDHQPEIQARLQATIGIVYTGLGAYTLAGPLLEKAVVNSQRVFGGEHQQTLNAVHALANLNWHQGRYGEAERLYSKVVETRRKQLGESDPATLRATYDLAGLYAMQNRLAEAEPLMRKTLEIQRRVLGEEHEDTLASNTDRNRRRR